MCDTRKRWDDPTNDVCGHGFSRGSGCPTCLRRENERLLAVVEAAKWLVDGPTDCKCWPECRKEGLIYALAAVEQARGEGEG